jgi:competence protein ComGC
LIELIIIIVILGILAAVAIPTYIDLKTDAANATGKGIFGALSGANAILYADRLIKGGGTTYTIADVIASANISGIEASATFANSFTCLIGGRTYTYTLNGTTVTVPTTPQTMSGTGW